MAGSGETESGNVEEISVELLLRSRVAKTGRPRKGEEGGTTQIRVFEDMAAMVSDLLLVLPLTTAQIVQRVCGNNLRELHETYKKQIDSVKAAERAAEEAKRKAQEEAAILEQREPSRPRRKKEES
jgi:hypothetical protein